MSGRMLEPEQERTQENALIHRIRPEFRDVTATALGDLNLGQREQEVFISLVELAQDRFPSSDMLNIIGALASALEDRGQNISELEPGLRHLIESMTTQHGSSAIISLLHPIFHNNHFQSSEFNPAFVDDLLGFYRRIYQDHETNGTPSHLIGWEAQILDTVFARPEFNRTMLNDGLADGIVSFSSAIDREVRYGYAAQNEIRLVRRIIERMANENFNINDINTRNADDMSALIRFTLPFADYIGTVDGFTAFNTIFNNPVVRSRLLDIPDLYAQGRALAETFRDLDPQQSRRLLMCIELGHAIQTMGRERVVDLHNATGIVYFSRYSREILENTYRHLDPAVDRELPLVVAVYPYSDFNGSFHYHNNYLDDLSRNYRVIVIETGNEESVYTAVTQLAQTHGPIDTLVLAGHGDPSAIQLGRGENEEATIDLTDAQQLRRLRGLVTANVIVNGCSTGAGRMNIARHLSDTLGIRAYAPPYDTTNMQIAFDRDGYIEDVQYVRATGDDILESGRRFRDSVPRRIR